MKKYLVFIIILFVSLTQFSCGGSEKKSNNSPTEIKSDVYQCPMKCSEQTFEKPGKCPVCGMELEKVSKG